MEVLKALDLGHRRTKVLQELIAAHPEARTTDQLVSATGIEGLKHPRISLFMALARLRQDLEPHGWTIENLVLNSNGSKGGQGRVAQYVLQKRQG